MARALGRPVLSLVIAFEVEEDEARALLRLAESPLVRPLLCGPDGAPLARFFGALGELFGPGLDDVDKARADLSARRAVR